MTNLSVDSQRKYVDTMYILNKEIKAGLPTTIRQQYDVFKTPTFYLLDANKKILAKNLSLEQFNDFLQNANNKSAPKN